MSTPRCQCGRVVAGHACAWVVPGTLASTAWWITLRWGSMAVCRCWYWDCRGLHRAMVWADYSENPLAVIWTCRPISTNRLCLTLRTVCRPRERFVPRRGNRDCRFYVNWNMSIETSRQGSCCANLRKSWSTLDPLGPVKPLGRSASLVTGLSQG